MEIDNIPFNIPLSLGNELDYVKEAIIVNKKLCGDGPFTKKCNSWFMDNSGVDSALLTTSCTSALEISAVLLNIKPGDEIIMPSYTFVSTALAFVMHGAKIVFVDIEPNYMNIDENLIEDAVTERTKAVVVVHYAGVACNMDVIERVCKKKNLILIEDAAQGMMSTYHGRVLGSIGDLGTYSFHETKNYTCGEGGVLLVHNKNFIERAEILREKGTNRANFLKGQVDKYTWVDKGSSWLPSELNAAYLYPQLLDSQKVNRARLDIWNQYYTGLTPLMNEGIIELPKIRENCNHNAHMFYIKTKDIDERTELISYLKERGISSVFHYVPLHSSPGGRKWGRFHGKDSFTTQESERLLRLPLYYGLKVEQIDRIVVAIECFYK